MSNSPFLTKNGIIVIDKPEGMTSAQVVAKVKRITGSKKVGHTGTLDPFATGLMICGINGGTRLSRFFLNSDKTYEAGLLLGVDTDTMDCTGSVVKSCETDFFNNNNIYIWDSKYKKHRSLKLNLRSEYSEHQDQVKHSQH